MICEYENFMLATLQVVSPSLEHFNNCQKLTVVSVIPSFYQNHLFGKKSYQILSARIIRGQLTENSTNSIARSIRLKLDKTLQIEMI